MGSHRSREGRYQQRSPRKGVGVCVGKAADDGQPGVSQEFWGLGSLELLPDDHLAGNRQGHMVFLKQLSAC